MRQHQLALDLAFSQSYAEEDFLTSKANLQAYKTIIDWPDWSSSTLALIGPQGSGKSHLAAIWADRAGARRVSAKDLNMDKLGHNLATGALLLEDATAECATIAFFHLLNMAKEEGSFLLITSKDTPAHWHLSLKDLDSRLRAIPTVVLQAPDDALLKAVYHKLFADRQMEVDKGVIEYLSLHGGRSLASAAQIVSKLDKISLEKGRRITKFLANEVLNYEIT